MKTPNDTNQPEFARIQPGSLHAHDLMNTTSRRRTPRGSLRLPTGWLPAFTLCLFGCLLTARAQDPVPNPYLPKDASVSLGVTVVFQASATTFKPPLTFQWQRSGTNLAGATLSTLRLTNVTELDAGEYQAIIRNASGESAISRVATLAVDPTFTKITEGPVVTDLGISPVAPAWGDLNNDDYPDLLIVDEGRWVSTNNYTRDVVKVYLNNRDGTFRRATEADIGPLAATETFLTPMSLADYDNDSYLDFYEYEGVYREPQKVAHLYRGGPDGKFTLVSEDAGINRPVNAWYDSGGFYPNPWGKSWVDYDQDGFLDVYLTVAWNYSSTVDQLWRNNGDRTFTRALTNVFKTVFDSQFACWSDYDNDGDPDVFVGGVSGAGRFYRNDGGGRFTDLTTSLRATLGSLGWYGAWGDYDNDGDLDLHAQTFLCQNNGAGGFVKQTGANYPPETGAGNWIDYDNDGYLDYFSHWAANRRLLMRNNRDGTFTRVTLGSVTEDPASNGTGAWADCDNNGFLDLMLCNRASNKPNDLYRNNGNGNHWILLNLVGTVANRSAIGAKVRAQATIWGKSVQQMREVSGTPFTGDLRVHCGLGDATNVTTLCIEWPSGNVQELANLTPNQILTVIEPRRPVLAVVVTPTLVTGTLMGDTNQVYQVLMSDDLATGWTVLTNVTTDASGKGNWSDSSPAPQGRRFYRALKTP